MKPTRHRSTKPYVEQRRAELEDFRPEIAERLIEQAGRNGRNGQRDKLMLTLLYTHALRLNEMTGLRWSQFVTSPRGSILTIKRLKGSAPSTHHLDKSEAQLLAAWRKIAPEGPWLFLSERGGPVSDQVVQRIVDQAAVALGLDVKWRPHGFRHACLTKLAEQRRTVHEMQLYGGHKDVRNLSRYIHLSAAALEGISPLAR